MDLVNSTPFPAKLAAGSTGDHEMVYVIACKLTAVLEDGRLCPITDEQAWPVFEAPFEFEGVPLSAELDVRKQGVDFLVFGKATAPGGRPIAKMNVSIECGEFRYEASVFGDRQWTQRGEDLTPSDASPFVEMPLTNDRAYGGVTVVDGFDMPHPVNPEGRGFYLTAEAAVDQPLPNLERPDALIRTCQDMPKPACFFKPKGSLLIDFPNEIDADKLMKDMLRYGFNDAIPPLVASLDDLGPELRLRGFVAEGDVVFPMPSLAGPTAHVVAGPTRSRFSSTLSTIVALPAARVLVATYRCAFRYHMQPLEKRSVELRWPSFALEPPIPA